MMDKDAFNPVQTGFTDWNIENTKNDDSGFHTWDGLRKIVGLKHEFDEYTLQLTSTPEFRGLQYLTVIPKSDEECSVVIPIIGFDATQFGIKARKFVQSRMKDRKYPNPNSTTGQIEKFVHISIKGLDYLERFDQLVRGVANFSYNYEQYLSYGIVRLLTKGFPDGVTFKNIRDMGAVIMVSKCFAHLDEDESPRTFIFSIPKYTHLQISRKKGHMTKIEFDFPTADNCFGSNGISRSYWEVLGKMMEL